jgi:hypothetical protein
MASAERGVSAPPEVVFGTATDPDRASAWLPEPLRADGASAEQLSTEELRARWSAAGQWSAEIRVEPADAGGSRMRLDLTGDADADRLADQALESLARAVADNLQAG